MHPATAENSRPAASVYARLLALAVWTVLLSALRLCALPVGIVRRSWDRAVRRRLFRWWGRGTLRLLGVRIAVQGVPPQPPFFQVANHQTFLDIVALAALQGCAFVSKAEVRSWPLFGQVGRTLGTIFIVRERRRDTRRANARIAEALAKGEGVQVFPEGGVIEPGKLAPFKSALLHAPVELGLPVHVAAIRYRTRPPVANGAAWTPGDSFPRHLLTLLRYRGVECVVAFPDAPLLGSDRKELARALHRETQKLLGDDA